MKLHFKTLFIILAIALFLPLIASAQTSQAMLTTEATASAVRYNGQWSVGTEETQSFPLLYLGAGKNNIFSLGVREILVPSVWNVYGAIGNFQPDISKLLALTTLSPQQFNISFDLVGGVATFASGTTASAPALEGRVNVNYAITPSTELTGAYAGGGLIGSKTFAVVSAGFAYVFGAPNTQSTLKKGFLLRRAVLHHFN